MKVRIGIDVGGTFTDAAVIDNETFELVGSVKVPTTHTAKEGVAAGIVQVLHKVMEECGVRPEDVAFIAHGTTQATNALLEGDVVKVGIVTLGSGLQGAKAKSDTVMGRIELARGKFLETENRFVSTEVPAEELKSAVKAAVGELTAAGCRSVVAAEAFSVDDPTNENLVMDVCADLGVPCTATNDISKLYGLKIRTRTAVVNASILPKMLETANMTEQSIKNAGITAPLMVMRCDGGVMTVDEVRRRPILTILSGPAAGVAGALMYEKLTDGLFFEVGGTSTDISCVTDGKVIVKYAEVGGHKTYLNSLDVHTVGIGGGSMVQIENGKAVDTGPRSAHIAGLDYEVYTEPENIVSPVLKTVRPMPSDPEYAYVECEGGRKYALTLSGAGNICGYAKDGDYARGNVEAAKKAWKPLADSMGITVEEAARKVLEFSAAKNGAVAKELMATYKMDPHTTMFIGGGGGAAVVVPHLGETLGFRSRMAKNAPVISTIGVALAMVRDVVERTVANPTQEDIVSVRREAELRAIQSGAAPGTVEVSVEVDPQRNLVRAVAVGATEMRTKDRAKEVLSREELLKIVSESMREAPSRLKITAENGSVFAVQCDQQKKKLFGLLHSVKHPLRLVDDEGVIRLQKQNASVSACTAETWEKAVQHFTAEMTIYNDGGAQYPNIYIAYGKRVIDLSGLRDEEQMLSIARVELAGAMKGEKLIVIATERVDS